MKPSSLVSCAAALFALVSINPSAMATPIDGAATGLSNPTVLITFDAPPSIDQNTAITNQYASLGVTFDTLYYNPFDPDNDGTYPTVNGNYLGNYQLTNDPDAAAFLDDQALTITFSNVQTRAAFGLQSNGGDGGDGNVFTFTAYLGGQFVESFQSSVGSGYYGFTGSQFDSIVVTSCVPSDADSCEANVALATIGVAASAAQVQLANPDYYLFDNLQFDAPAVTPSGVPEPQIASLFGLGLFGATMMRRRRSGSRARAA